MTETPISNAGERRTAGRPPVLSDTERRQRILTAAEGLFFTQGYAATSMDDVARACGMSKKTIYRLFDRKEALFSELIDATLGSLQKYATGNDGPEIDGEAMLRGVLTDLSKLLLHPRQIALARLVIAEAPHAPEIAESTGNRGIAQAEQTILGVLSDLHRRGWMRSPPTLDLSRLLLGAVIGDLPFKILIGLSQSPSLEEIEARVDRLFGLMRGDLFAWEPARRAP